MYSVYKDFLKVSELKTLKQCAEFLGVTEQNLHFLNPKKAPVYDCRGHMIIKTGNQAGRALFKARKLLYLVECCPSPSLAEAAADSALRIIQHSVID